LRALLWGLGVCWVWFFSLINSNFCGYFIDFGWRLLSVKDDFRPWSHPEIRNQARVSILVILDFWISTKYPK
jgi:hypothetical protein